MNHPADTQLVQSPRASRTTSGDGGFTIVELVVALSLVAFVLTTLAGLFYTGMKVAVDTNARTQATGVAVRALESMRVARYDELGFYTSQDGYEEHCDPTNSAADTVTLGDTAPADAKYTPLETIFVPERSLPFNVERCVVWADPSDPSLAQGFKRTFVKVTWTVQGRTHSVTEHSIVYPGGLGSYAGAQQHPTTPAVGPGVVPPAPASVTVTTPGAPVGETQLDVNWSDPNQPHHYKAQASTVADFSAIAGESATIDGLTKTIPVTGLAPGTFYYVRVIAYGDEAELAASLPTSAPGQYKTLDAAPGGSCSVGPLAVTTTGPSNSKVYRSSSGTLGVDLGFSATFTGACPLTYHVVAVGPQPGTDERPTAAESPWTLSGFGERTATVDQDAVVWAPGVYEFQVRHGINATGSIGSLTVCEYTTKPNYSKKGC